MSPRLLFLVLALSSVIYIKSQPQLPARPIISSSFQSAVIIQLVPWGPERVSEVEGFMIVDADNQNQLIITNNSVAIEYVLSTYSTGQQFTFFANDSHCSISHLNDNFFPLFSWTNYSVWLGEDLLREEIVDVWGFQAMNVTLTLAVSRIWQDLPMRLTIAAEHGRVTQIIDFFEFYPSPPPANTFAVPHFCM